MSGLLSLRGARLPDVSSLPLVIVVVDAKICVVCGFFVTVCLRAVVRGWHNCLQRPMWMLNAVITFSSVLVVIMAFW